MRKYFKILFLNAILTSSTLSTPAWAAADETVNDNWTDKVGKAGESVLDFFLPPNSEVDLACMQEAAAKIEQINAIPNNLLSPQEKEGLIQGIIKEVPDQITHRKSASYRSKHAAGQVIQGTATGTRDILYESLLGASVNRQGQRIGESILQNLFNEMFRPIKEIGVQGISDSAPPRVWLQSQSVEKTNMGFNDLMYPDAVQEQLEAFLWDLTTANTKGEGLPNLLLYGPSGTGKTIFAKLLKNHPGTDFEIVMVKTQMLLAASEGYEIDNWMMTGAKKRNAFEHLLSYVDQPYKKWGSFFRGNSKKKIGLIFDEGELILTPRHGQPTEEINAFLQKLGTLSKNFFVVFCTNNPGNIDRRALNRFPHSIHVTNPDASTRLRILSHYVQKRISSAPELHHLKPIDELFDAENSETQEFITASESLAGRQLQDVANAAINRAHINSKRCKDALTKGKACFKPENDRDHAEDTDPNVISARMLLAKVQFEHTKVKEREEMAKAQDARDAEEMRKTLERAAMKQLIEKEIRDNVAKKTSEMAKKDKKQKPSNDSNSN